jgi:hypothetical protein
MKAWNTHISDGLEDETVHFVTDLGCKLPVQKLKPATHTTSVKWKTVSSTVFFYLWRYFYKTRKNFLLYKVTV